MNVRLTRRIIADRMDGDDDKFAVEPPCQMEVYPGYPIVEELVWGVEWLQCACSEPCILLSKRSYYPTGHDC